MSLVWLALVACGPKREVCEYGRPIKSSPRQPDLNMRRCPKNFGDAGVGDAAGSAEPNRDNQGERP